MKKLISRIFGTTPMIEKASGDASGVIIGACNGQPLIDGSMNPVAVLGPCRSGKGTSIVVPTLLTWRESAIVADVQGELFGITEHWRRNGAHNEVRRLAFGDPNSPDTYNFLEAISRGTAGELQEIHALAESLLSDALGSSEDCRRHAQSLLSLLIIAKRSDVVASLHDVLQAVSDNAAFDATIATYRDIIPNNEINQAAKAAATAYSELPAQERVGVRALVAKSLTIFASPDVSRNTLRSSFDLAELRDGETAKTLYLSFAAHDIDRLQPLIRAFLTQVVRHGTQERQQPAAHRMLLVLDALTALGRLSFLEDSLPHLPVHGIKALLVLGSLSELNDVYGKQNSVWQRCAIRTVLPLNDFETAGIVADGIARHPITPDELMRMGRREAVILGASAKPICAATLPYYESALFRARAEGCNAAPLFETAAVVPHC